MPLYKITRGHGDPTYDANDGFVIRAGSKDEARKIASEHSADEGPEVWLTPGRSACDTLEADGRPEVVLRDFNAG